MARFDSLFRPTVVGAGVLLSAGNVMSLGRPDRFSDAAKTALFELSSVLLLVGGFALLFALVGMHVRQGDRAGGFGLFAAIVAAVGTVLFCGLSWSQTFLDPAAAKVVPAFLDDQPPAVLIAGLYLSLALFAVGWVLYAIATLRARVFARVPAVILLVGAILALAPMPVGQTIVGLGLIWLGLGTSGERVGQVVPPV
jgi:hypothetical protein